MVWLTSGQLPPDSERKRTTEDPPRATMTNISVHPSAKEMPAKELAPSRRREARQRQGEGGGGGSGARQGRRANLLAQFY